MDFDFVGIHGTVWCWLWTSSAYVNISAFLNLENLIPGIIECAMARSQLNIHVLFKFTSMATIHTAPDGFRFWWNIWNGILLALDEQRVR